MKAVGVLVIGLGLIMIVIGITGTQSQVLSGIKGISPTLRNATGANTGQSAVQAVGNAALNPPGLTSATGGTNATSGGASIV